MHPSFNYGFWKLNFLIKIAVLWRNFFIPNNSFEKAFPSKSAEKFKWNKFPSDNLIEMNELRSCYPFPIITNEILTLQLSKLNICFPISIHNPPARTGTGRIYTAT